MTMILETKKKKLKESKKKLELQERQLIEKEKKMKARLQIKKAALIEKSGLGHLDEETLLGAFLEITEKLNNDDTIHNWKEAGIKFLQKEQKQNKVPLIISFPKDHDSSLIERLKSMKFRWNRFRKEWYGEGIQEEIETIFKDSNATIEVLDL